MNCFSIKNLGLSSLSYMHICMYMLRSKLDFDIIQIVSF